jgi:hypothetical protein
MNRGLVTFLSALLPLSRVFAAESAVEPREVEVWRAALVYETSKKPRRVSDWTTEAWADDIAEVLRPDVGGCGDAQWPADSARRMQSASDDFVRLDESLWAIPNVRRMHRHGRARFDLSLSRAFFDESGTRALLYIEMSDSSSDLLEASFAEGRWTIRVCGSWLTLY